MRVGTDCIVIDVEVGMERLTQKKIQTHPLKNQSPNKSMNKKLKSKDEKKNTYRRSFDDKFPGVLGLLKDEKKVEGWERVMKSKAKKNWEAELQDIFNTLELKERESDDFSIAYMGTYSLIRQLLADSKIEWQEEQNRVVNSGRKLFQEGQKTERERIIGEVEKMRISTGINYRRMIGRVWECVVCKKSLKGRRGHPVMCLDCAAKKNKDRLRNAVYNCALDDILHILKGKK